MKGLLTKELYLLRSNMKAQAFSLGLFVFLGVMMKSTAYLSMMVTIMISNMLLLSIGYDEKCAWSRYAMTMPVCRRDLIRVKYMLLYILTAGSVLLNVIIGIPMSMVLQIPVAESVLGAIGCAVFSMCAASVNILLCTKFGVEKARLMTVASYLLPFGMLWIFFMILEKRNMDLSWVTGWHVGIAITIVAVIVFLVSQILCRISCRIIEGQDL